MKKLTVALALGLASSSVLALGLGQIKVKSGLNEPLRAEIPVLSSSASELHGLKVELASAEDFSRAGLSLAQLDVPLQFAVVTKQGDTVIEVTTKEAVSDPALDFLVAVNWPKGKLLREYTILLDPPNMAPVVMATPAVPSAPAVTAAPATTRPVSVPVQPTAPSAPPASTTPASAAPAARAQVTRTTPAPAPGGAITVNKGDTLWRIADGTHDAAGVSINEMMLALQRTNPEAFYQNNINALKSGAVLRMPDRQELAKLSTSAALAAVREQDQRWASVHVQAPVMVANTGGSTSSANERGGERSPERLALVPPSTGGDAATSRPGVAGGTGSTTIHNLQTELANAKTALTSAQQESTDLQRRVNDLEGINDKSTNLISLKNAEIAELQRKLADAQSAERAAAAAPAVAATVRSDIFNASAPASAVTIAAAEAAPVAASTAVTVQASALAAPASTAISPATTPTETTLAETEPTSAPAAVQPPATPDAAGQPWYMQNWLKYLVGAVILLLILLGFMRSRRKSSDPKLPIAEDAAEVEHGDEDEEFALIDELQQRPDDLATHMELASLYYAQHDQDKFEAAAEVMHAHVTDPQSEEWQQVRAMGEELCPDSPLFAGARSDGDLSTVAAAAPTTTAVHDDADAGNRQTGTADDGYSFDFNLTPMMTPKPIEPVSDDYDLAVEPPAPAAADQAPDDDDLGFGILGELHADATDDDELDEQTAHGSFSSDPVDTKLDLARAYQDMGDAEGARAMLDEVLAEGSDAQKEVARKLIDELGSDT